MGNNTNMSKLPDWEESFEEDFNSLLRDVKFNSQDSFRKIPKEGCSRNPELVQFSQREYFLDVADRMQLMNDCFKQLEGYVTREAEFDSQVVSTFLARLQSFVSHSRSPDLRADVMKEARILETTEAEMWSNLKILLKAVAECFGNRKSAYANQLRRMKEVSNAAIRNALQHERGESSMSLLRLRETLAQENAETVQSIQSKLSEADQLLRRLHGELEETRSQLLYARSQLEHSSQEKAAAVARALQDQRSEFEAERIQFERVLESERTRLKEELSERLKNIATEYNLQLESVKRHGEDVRELLSSDKTRLEAEIAKLREQLLTALTQVSKEKERCGQKLNELRVQLEKEVQQVQSQAIHDQSTMQAEFGRRIEALKDEESAELHALKKDFMREKEAIHLNHTMELEKLLDRQKTELRRNQAQYEVRLQEAISRLKHTHEQELGRTLRENERLQRLVARGLLTSGQNAREFISPQRTNCSTAGNLSVAIARNFNSSSVRGDKNEILRKSLDPEPSLWAPQPTPQQNHQVGSKPLGLNWGSLRESLHQQELEEEARISEQRNRMAAATAALRRSHERVPSPPDSFLLDEALAITRQVEKERKSGLEDLGGSLSGSPTRRNAEQVDKYLGKLQKYLEGSTPSPSMDGLISSSRSEIMDLSQLAASDVFTSQISQEQDDGTSRSESRSHFDDEDDLFGENIVANLSEISKN